MSYKQMIHGILAFLLMFTVVVSPALAASEDVWSDDKVLGFEKNHDYKLEDDLSLQDGVDVASSIPLWGVSIGVILVLAVAVLLMVPGVIEWNILKGGNAAVGGNPVKAAQGIKDAKMINRAYTSQVIEGFIIIGAVVFIVALAL